MWTKTARGSLRACAAQRGEEEEEEEEDNNLHSSLRNARNLWPKTPARARESRVVRFSLSQLLFKTKSETFHDLSRLEEPGAHLAIQLPKLSQLAHDLAPHYDVVRRALKTFAGFYTRGPRAGLKRRREKSVPFLNEKTLNERRLALDAQTRRTRERERERERERGEERYVCPRARARASAARLAEDCHIQKCLN